jgi:hypothetical protein
MNIHKNALNLDEKSSDNKGLSMPKMENSIFNSSDERGKPEIPNVVYEVEKNKDGIHLL